MGFRIATAPRLETMLDDMARSIAAAWPGGMSIVGVLRERGIEEVFLCGIARDVCVKWSAEDAVEAGFRTRVLWDLTRPVDPSSDEAVRADLDKAGAEVVMSDAL